MNEYVREFNVQYLSWPWNYKHSNDDVTWNTKEKFPQKISQWNVGESRENNNCNVIFWDRWSVKESFAY